MKSREKNYGVTMRECLKFLSLCVFLFSSAFVFSDSASSFSDEVDVKRVLVLHSYHKGLSWTDKVSDGIDEVFESEDEFTVKVRYEFMDTKNFYSEAYLQSLHDLYLMKFQGTEFDAIITSDDNAFHFMQQYHDEIFGDSPVIFCGLNFFDPSAPDLLENMTGLIEDYDISKTVEMIRILQPEVTNLVILNDRSPTAISMENALSNIYHSYADELSFTVLPFLPMTEILSELQQYGEGSAVLLVHYLRDSNQKTFTYFESTKLICDAALVPVYGAFSIQIGYGSIGGWVIDPVSHGEQAAELALRVLKGEDATSIPVQNDPEPTYIFDEEVMQTFGISSSVLPVGTVLLNHPESFFRQNIWAFIFIFLLMVLLLVQLMTNRSTKNADKKQIQDFKDRYRLLNDTAFEAVVVCVDGRIVEINPQFCEITGYEENAALGMRFFNLIAPDERSTLEESFVLNAEYLSEVKIQKTDDMICWVDLRTRETRFDGHPARLITFVDISKLKQKEETVRRWFKFEQTTSNILSHYIEISDIETVINVSLHDLGNFADADRAYVFRFSDDGQTMSNTHEWCAEGVGAEIENLQNIRLDEMQWWAKRVMEGQLIHINDVSQLPAEAAEVRRMLEMQSIRSLVVFPVKSRGKIWGFAGLDKNNMVQYWTEEQIALLRMFCEVLGKSFARLEKFS